MPDGGAGEANGTAPFIAMPAISGDGRYVAFGGGQSAPLADPDIVMSSDGRYVAFVSAAADLLAPGQDTNSVSDVFVRDRLRGTTERVSVATGGIQGDDQSGTQVGLTIALSGDGNVVLFESDADNFWPSQTAPPGNPTTYLHDRTTGVTEPLAFLAAGYGSAVVAGDLMPAGLSSDGRARPQGPQPAGTALPDRRQARMILDPGGIRLELIAPAAR